jgi:predicted ATPase
MPSAVQRLRTGGHPDAWQRISAVLTEIAPHVEDAYVSQLLSGQEFISFREHQKGRPVESWQASDGTLRALAILVALETMPEFGMALIEEPEMGLHPWAVRTLINYCREVIERRRLQVVLSTHSQHVLDELDPSEVRVAIRPAGRGTQFLELTEVVPAQHFERGEVGRLWVTGLLSGVPEPNTD